MANLLPNGKMQICGYSGTPSIWGPLVYGKIYTYIAGTSTPLPTFTTAAATVENTNPVILDARGEATIFWDGNYKIVVKDADDVILYTVDNVSADVLSSNIVYGSEDLSFILLNNLSHVVENITELRAIDKTLYTSAFVKGYYAAGDGGGGNYYYDAGDNSSADNSGTIIVADDTGRWKLEMFGKSVSVLQFGAKPDYATSASSAFAAAIAWAAESETEITVDGAFLITTALNITAGVKLKGNYAPSLSALPSVSVASCLVFTGAAMSGTYGGGAFGSGAVIDGILCMHFNLSPAGGNSLPFADAAAAAVGVAAFSGTPFRISGASLTMGTVKNCGFFGFSRVFDVAAFGFNGALNVDNIVFDCTNGLYLGKPAFGAVVRCSIKNARGYPVTTVNVASASNLRTGSGFICSGAFADYSDCSAYGYAIGFEITSANATTAGCSVTAPDIANTCVGFLYTGATYPAVNIGSTCLNMGGAAIKSDKPADGGVYYDTSVIGGTFINGATAVSTNGQIWFYDGYGSISNCYFGGNDTFGSIKLSDTAGQVNIDDISVSGAIVPIFGDAPSILLARIGKITYRQAAPILQPMRWTPVVKCGTTVQTGVWYGSYTVQNSYVTCVFSFAFGGAAPAGGNMTIEGLPYVCNYDNGDGQSTSGCAYYTNLTAAGFPHFRVVNGTSVVDCYYATATASTALTHAKLNNNTTLYGSVTYKIIT